MRFAPAYVYFLRPVGMDGPVKIGCSSAPISRLVHMLRVSPWPLRLVAKLPGDESLERRFHALFAESHSHCEWFHSTPLLAEVIRQVEAGTFDTSSLPPPRRFPNGADRRSPEALENRAIREALTAHFRNGCAHWPREFRATADALAYLTGEDRAEALAFLRAPLRKEAA